MKAVLFDLDGTISNSKEGITKSIQYALKHLGIEETDLDKLAPFIGPPLTDSFKKYYDFTPEQTKIAIEKFRERYAPIGLKECEMYPNVRECLEVLKEQGYVIGLASSKVEKFCKIILEQFGILELFDDVVGATMDGSIATKEEVLEEVFRRWSHIPKSETCLVGDTIFDINGAKEHGIACIAVTFGYGDIQEMKEAGVWAFCDDFMELPDILAGRKA